MSDLKYNYYSIIIPSFNRDEEIDELLASLSNLEFNTNQFEVIIADDGSTDQTQLMVKRYQKSVKFTLYYYSQKNQGPGAARNLGMEKAKGDFFIFIDSDVLLPKDWLQNIVAELETTGADAFGGPDTYLKNFSPLLKAINYSMTSFITTGGLRGKKGKKLAKYYPRSFNMGLTRRLWEKIGGFHPQLYGEDIEFSHRIINAGAKVIFIESAFLYHKRRTNLKKFFIQVYKMGSARIFLFKIDKTMLEPLHAIPAFATLAVILVLTGAIFLESFRWILIIGLSVFMIFFIFLIIDCIIKYKAVKPALLLPFVITTQVFGYGLGFIYNYILHIIFSKNEKA